MCSAEPDLQHNSLVGQKLSGLTLFEPSPCGYRLSLLHCLFRQLLLWFALMCTGWLQPACARVLVGAQSDPLPHIQAKLSASLNCLSLKTLLLLGHKGCGPYSFGGCSSGLDGGWYIRDIFRRNPLSASPLPFALCHQGNHTHGVKWSCPQPQ